MAALGNLTLTDAAATPVNHTYYPQPDTNNVGLARWVDRASGIALGFPFVTLWMRRPSPATRSWKVTAKVSMPVLEVTSPSTASGIQPAPTLAYTLIANVDFVLPERSTLQERKDLLAIFKDYMSDAVITAAIQDYDPPY